MIHWRKAGVVCVLLLAAVGVKAEPAAQLKPTGYVDDFAGVLDAATRSKLEALCHQIDQEAHAQIAVVTIRTLDGSDIESYAVDLYKRWGVGNKSTNRGVLILLASQDHKYRVEVGYGLEPILPDGKVGGFGREAVPFLRQGDYNGAITLMTVRVAQVIADDAKITIDAQVPTRHPEASEAPGVGGIVTLLAVLVIGGIFVIFLWQGLTGRGGRSTWRGGPWMGGGGGWTGGGGGGWGGGGFGGGGGGGFGGFGGFGGGMSGGGGASGSW